MKLSAILLAVASAIIASPAHAEKPTGPVYQHLKDLESFVGEWEGRFDPPGEVPIGLCSVSANWACFKSYLTIDVLFAPDNANVVLDPMKSIIGYNGETKSVQAWEFRITSPSTAIVQLTNDKMVMEFKGVDYQGKQVSRTTTFEKRSDDEMVVRNTNIMRAGKPSPEEVEDDLILKRKSSK